MPDIDLLGGTAYANHALHSLIVPADTVSPHPENPRIGDTDKIMESLRVNGCYRPLYVQASTGYIVAGNHTYAALMEMGAERLPVIALTIDDAQAKRILLADNKIAEFGEYDDGQLFDLLRDVTLNVEGGLLGTGWTDDDLLPLAETVADAVTDDLDLRQPDLCPECGQILRRPRTRP